MTVFMLMTSVVLAHSMPREEMYIGGVGSGCTMGYVKSIYGEPQDMRYDTLGNILIVRYIYKNGSTYFDVVGRALVDPEPVEADIKVVGFSVTDKYLSTPSGFKVGSSYDQIVAKYGPGEKLVNNGETGYCYSSPNTAVDITFYVDEKNIITRIYEGTEL